MRRYAHAVTLVNVCCGTYGHCDSSRHPTHTSRVTRQHARHSTPPHHQRGAMVPSSSLGGRVGCFVVSASCPRCFRVGVAHDQHKSGPHSWSAIFAGCVVSGCAVRDCQAVAGTTASAIIHHAIRRQRWYETGVCERACRGGPNRVRWLTAHRWTWVHPVLQPPDRVLPDHAVRGLSVA